MVKKVKVYLVIPCFNEEKVLLMTIPVFINELKELIKLGMISEESRILCVNDGSDDETWTIIEKLVTENNVVEGICLSRNMGHQNAVYAGLMEVKDRCDAAITMDCDGQDDIGVVRKMIEEFQKGFDVVYGVRSSRNTDSFAKRFSAESYYKLLKAMGGDIVYNHADFRLMSRRVIEELARYNEVNLYLRGIIPLIGFDSTKVYYDRQSRVEGNTHYSFSKMIALAIEGITSLSIKPIKYISAIGIWVAIISFVGIIWSICGAISGNVISGWTSIICIICFVSGVQILSLGILGEYIGKIYLETKRRPRYIVQKRIGIDEKE